MNAVLAVEGKCVVDSTSPAPSPGAGEMLVKVHACGINRLDTMQRQGKVKPPPGASLVLGMEVAGEV
jgi:NADPH:quinone reductase-like Zn-dependent oxidoreductase